MSARISNEELDELICGAEITAEACLTVAPGKSHTITAQNELFAFLELKALRSALDRATGEVISQKGAA